MKKPYKNVPRIRISRPPTYVVVVWGLAWLKFGWEVTVTEKFSTNVSVVRICTHFVLVWGLALILNLFGMLQWWRNKCFGIKDLYTCYHCFRSCVTFQFDRSCIFFKNLFLVVTFSFIPISKLISTRTLSLSVERPLTRRGRFYITSSIQGPYFI